MGTAVTTLRTESEALLQAAGVLGRLCQQAAREALDHHASDAGDVVAFLAEFGDGCHYAKKERLLFPMLVQRGVATDSGPVAVQRSGRIQARELLDAMRHAQVSWAVGNGRSGRRFSIAATAYHALLEWLIDAERNVLFTIVDRVLDHHEQKRLVQSFAQFDREVLGNERRQALMGGIEALRRQYA
jgi:hemerythrin-like domain-containing protein